ncbi:site-specific integrase [Streptomyces coeruleorubidus]|uniref:site-specific integrase n=1 Tax=Streptomyces coeruleorubidus TaxID=116188 RepID=UPI0033EDC434
MSKWRVFWVPKPASIAGPRVPVLAGWANLAEHEAATGIRPGDPILLAPDYRIDELLSLYTRSSPFRGYTKETKRNYITDLCLFLNFLWQRGKVWTQAVESDVDDFQFWRRTSPENPVRVGGNKWNRELAALMNLYTWATKPGNEFLPRDPVPRHRVVGRHGQVVEMPDGKAKDARGSNVHWLTPRTFRLWVDVGLRGYGADGLPAPGWVGRLEDRNVAFVRLLTSSGVRRLEGASLLTFEVPSLRLEGGRYYTGRHAAAVTRSKKARTYYVEAHVVGDIENYVDSSRAEAIRTAQAVGRYEDVRDMRLVTRVSRGPKPTVYWCDRQGVTGRIALTEATADERMTWYTEGPAGPEPLWLWLNEMGLPFQPHSWNNVFAAANRRCQAVLDPEPERRLDPHRSRAPYATPHSCRHSFALYMLVILHHLMDQRFGLSPEERRDYRLLYGDPWRMVQDLLGHAFLETTRERYLAPVADLQLRSLLTTAPPFCEGEPPARQMDEVFARLAREAEGIQDIDAKLQVTPRAAR